MKDGVTQSCGECDEARAEGGGEEADGIQNQKQEPHTKMCGTTTTLDPD